MNLTFREESYNSNYSETTKQTQCVHVPEQPRRGYRVVTMTTNHEYHGKISLNDISSHANSYQ